MMKVFVGDDWAEAHHDVHLMNGNGDKLATKRLPEGLDGIAGFHEMVADDVEDPSEVIIGIETERGMWVQALIAAGYTVFAINPLSASRYRDRHSVAGTKSDPGDAKLLADLVRTDRHNHRPVAGDSDQADGVKVLARAHQNLIWDRTGHTNRLRNDLREYFPAALVAFEELSHRDAIAVLAKTPAPRPGPADLSRSDPICVKARRTSTQPRHTSRRDPNSVAHTPTRGVASSDRCVRSNHESLGRRDRRAQRRDQRPRDRTRIVF
jgi:transposase